MRRVQPSNTRSKSATPCSSRVLTHADTAVSDFFGPGIKLPARIPNDTPLRLVISSEMSVAGMPTALIE